MQCICLSVVVTCNVIILYDREMKNQLSLFSSNRRGIFVLNINISIYQYINISIYQYTNISIYQYINISIYQYINIIYQYINIPIYQYINISIYQYINISIYQYIDISTYQHCRGLYWDYISTSGMPLQGHRPTVTYDYSARTYHVNTSFNGFPRGCLLFSFKKAHARVVSSDHRRFRYMLSIIGSFPFILQHINISTYQHIYISIYQYIDISIYQYINIYFQQNIYILKYIYFYIYIYIFSSM